jgi:hypothetical protein
MELGDRLKLGIVAVACTAGLALCGSASASASVVTLGETASGSGTLCHAGDFYTVASPATPSYTIPAGGGAIDKWSTATFGGSAGAPITLLVLEPTEGGSPYQLVAFDTESLPTAFQLDNQTTFTPASPIEVPAGAVLGLWSSAGTEECSFADAADTITSGTSPAPVDGATYTGFSGGHSALNVSADLVQGVDAGLTLAAPPASTTAGAVAAFNFSLTNAGPSSDRTAFSDTVPKGLDRRRDHGLGLVQHQRASRHLHDRVDRAGLEDSHLDPGPDLRPGLVRGHGERRQQHIGGPEQRQ